MHGWGWPTHRVNLAPVSYDLCFFVLSIKAMRAAFVLSLLISLLPSIANAVNEPSYAVLLKNEKFEVRQYQAMILAQVNVTGDMRDAGSSGFRPLADFIFGNNQLATKVDMTAPVTRSESTKIAMTAPVTRVENENESWTVSFVMPEKWTMQTLPKPNNPDINIIQVPSEMVAILEFSGRGSEAMHKEKQAELEQWIVEQGYTAVSEPRYAGYDAPWVPWPFRRNEVMISVVK
jgi:hypothetical protein